MNGSEGEKFLKAIWPENYGYGEFRFIKKGYEIERAFFKPGYMDWKVIERAIKDGCNIHPGVALRKRRGGTKEDVGQISALWADMDGKDFPGGKEEILRQTLQLPLSLRPSIIIDSGNGYHLYWLLKEPENIEGEEDIKRVEGYLKGLCKRLGGDNKSAEIARVMRLPGTMNVKDPENPKPCKIVEFHDDRRFDLDDFSDFYVGDKATNGESFHGNMPPHTDPMRRASAYLAKIPGAVSGQGGHADTWKAALSVVKGFSLSEEEAFYLLKNEYNPRCIPPWSEKEIRHKITDAEKSEIPDGYLLSDSSYTATGMNGTSKNHSENGTTKPNSLQHLTDLGNAKRLVSRHGKDLLYCHKWKSWFVWNGRHWVKDESGEVIRKAKETVLQIYNEATLASDDDRPKLATHAMKSESEAKLRAMISLAESEADIVVTPNQFDSEPMSLNVQNGTINLLTGTLKEHCREDLITNISPVTFDLEATCHDWKQFLSKIFKGNEDLIEFIWKMLGYSLTGKTDEQCLFLLIGTGSNGKTTLLEILKYILSNYAKQADFSTFLIGDPNKIRNDVARLAGARFISASEAESGQHLSEALLKQLTAGDTVTARFLHQEFFEFKPTFKIFLAANHKPVIRGTDHAIWRRIRLVPFTVTIPDDEQDKNLFSKLKAEAPGILAWLVRGCLAWQKEGLGIPEAVRAATEDYRSDMDSLADFLADRCWKDPSSSTSIHDLYKAYLDYSGDVGDKRPLQKRTFGSALEERGFAPGKSGSTRIRKGIKLKEIRPFND